MLIKQFTHALTWASDPAKALASFDQFLDLIVKDQGKNGKSQALDFISDKKPFRCSHRLLGASDFLWEDFLRRSARQPPSAAHGIPGCPLIKPAGDPSERTRTSGRRAAKTDEARKDGLEPV